MTRECGDMDVSAGREGVPGAYAFLARYVVMPWDSVIDVGGGLGRGIAILQRRTRRVRAIDRDPRLSAFGVEVGDIRTEPSSAFDWVVAVDVIEHVEDDRDFLGNIWRVARKGIFVTTPNLAHHPAAIWPYHLREYRRDEFASLFAQVIPGAATLHFGGEIYGGQMRLSHTGSQWEHQGVLAVRRHASVWRCWFGLRENVLRIVRPE